MARNNNINRSEDLTFLLFQYTDEVWGITRLQKILFLLQKETQFGEVYNDATFEFEPYYYGPFSDGVYDAIDFLEVIGAIKTVEIDEADDLRRASDQNRHSGKKFVLTETGEKICEGLGGTADDEINEEIETVVNQYLDMTTEEMLQYVYQQYPEYAKNSKISDEILS